MLPGVTCTRLGADRCPGLLKPFVAQDGAIIRLRVPGGRVRVSTLADLLAIGADHGAPLLSVTSRTNLQVRGLPDPLPDDVMVDKTGLEPATLSALEAMGHTFRRIDAWGDAEAVLVDPVTKLRYGGSDPRNEGAPTGHD